MDRPEVRGESLGRSPGGSLGGFAGGREGDKTYGKRIVFGSPGSESVENVQSGESKVLKPRKM